MRIDHPTASTAGDRPPIAVRDAAQKRQRSRCVRLVALAIALALLVAPTGARALSGGLDPGFGSGGLLSLPVAPGAALDEAYAVVVDGDDRIVAAGFASDGKELAAVVRLLPNGNLDSSFAGSGTLKVEIGTRARALAVAFQDDGKIVVAGYAAVSGSERFAVVRVLESGLPDPDFGTDGVVTTPFGTRDARAQAVVVQADGRIVVAGWARNTSNRDVVLARYDESGALDPDFGDGGTLALAPNDGNEEAWALALQDDQRIVVAGYDVEGGEYDTLVLRLLDDGSLDPDFADGGSLRIPFATGDETARGVAIDASGRIVVAGDANIGGTPHIAVARLDEDGVLDATFGNGGKVVTLVGEHAQARAVALSSRGRVLVAGRARLPNAATQMDFVAARYSTTGALDPTFGTDGAVTIPIGGKVDDAFGIALHEADGVVLAGSTRTGGNTNFGFARLLIDDCGDGFLDPNEECDPGIGGGASCCSTSCAILDAGSVCRATAGTCDVAETCDGVATSCPADVVIDAGVSCRASTGVCDLEEQCDGTAPACPADAHVTAGTVCRAGTDLCDASETCDGATGDCPADQLSLAGATCRAAAGGCDVAELCDGTTAVCPADAIAEAGSVCRAAADDCDVVESCDGLSVACPTDVGLPDGDGDGTCDEQDVCADVSDPSQADGDGDGIGDACDACTSGVGVTNAVAKIGGILTPPGDDTLRITGTLTFPTVPTLTPATHGARIVLTDGSGAVLHDVTLPPGASTDETPAGWRSMRGGKVLLFKSPTLVGGVLRKMKLTRALTPGRYHVKITGDGADLTSLASQAALGVLISVNPTTPIVTLCGEVALQSCAPNTEGETLVCR